MIIQQLKAWMIHTLQHLLLLLGSGNASDISTGYINSARFSGSAF